MKKTLLSRLVVALLLTWGACLWAKDTPEAPPTVGTKSVAVISITSYDQLLKDVAFLGEVSGNPGLDQNLEGMLKFVTGGQGLKGLDTTKPWGATVLTDGTQFQPLVFLPVKSLKDLLGALGSMIGEPEDQGDGVFALQAGPTKVFAKEIGGWAFIGQTPESFAGAPKDPTKLLAGLNTQYDVAIRLSVQNIPEMYRSMAIDQLKAGVEQNLQKEANEDEDTFATRKKLMEMQVQQLTTAINESKDVTVGWKIDTEAKSTHLDVQITGIAGSKLAEQLAAVQEMPSAFTGFYDGKAAAAAYAASKINEDQVEQTIAAIDSMLSAVTKKIKEIKDPKAQAAAKGILEDVRGIVKSTAKSGKTDGGGAVLLDDGKLAIIGGLYSPEPKRFEDVVKKLPDLAKADKNNKLELKLNAAKHGAINFHLVSGPIKEGDEARKLLGEKVEAWIGIGDKAVFVAIGQGSLDKLKAAIDSSTANVTKKVLPVRAQISLGTIFKFAATMEPNPAIEMMSDELAKAEGKDHVTLAAKPQATGGGVIYRITAEEGVLRLLGQASRMAGPGGPGGGGPPGAGPPGGFEN